MKYTAMPKTTAAGIEREKERAAIRERRPKAREGSSPGSGNEHAAALNGAPARHPSNRSVRTEAVKELQRTRGNSYVQRMVDRIQREGAAATEIAPTVERAIRTWLEANPAMASVILRPEVLCERIRRNVPEAAGLADDAIQSVVNRWRLSRGLAAGMFGPPAPAGGVPSAPVIPPKKEPMTPSAFAARIRQVTDAFSKIPTKVEIKPSEGHTITVDYEGVQVASARGGITQFMGAGWNGSFEVGAEAGDLKFSAAVKPDSYSFSLRIGPEVTAIDKLPGIVTKAEQGLRDLIGDIGALKLSTLDKVKESMGAISDHVKPIKEAVDTCSKLEPKGTSVSFSLTAEFPRGESEEGMKIMGMLTVRF